MITDLFLVIITGENCTLGCSGLVSKSELLSSWFGGLDVVQYLTKSQFLRDDAFFCENNHIMAHSFMKTVVLWHILS